MDIYRELILDHYKHPKNFGSLKNKTSSAQALNATCGDRIVMDVHVDSKKKLVDVKFSGVGCAISQASASMLTEKVKGLSTEKILSITAEDIIAMLGTTLTPSRIKCATLPLEVLHAALLSKSV